MMCGLLTQLARSFSNTGYADKMSCRQADPSLVCEFVCLLMSLSMSVYSLVSLTCSQLTPPDVTQLGRRVVPCRAL